MGFFAVFMLILLGLTGSMLMGQLDQAKRRKVKDRCERDYRGRA